MSAVFTVYRFVLFYLKSDFNFKHVCTMVSKKHKGLRELVELMGAVNSLFKNSLPKPNRIDRIEKLLSKLNSRGEYIYVFLMFKFRLLLKMVVMLLRT